MLKYHLLPVLLLNELQKQRQLQMGVKESVRQPYNFGLTSREVESSVRVISRVIAGLPLERPHFGWKYTAP
jgi:hypothetical protein